MANVPRSRSERRRDETARAAMVTVDAMGGDLDRLIGSGDKAWMATVVGDPSCPIRERDLSLPEDQRSDHRCTARCFLGGWHAYSPRQGRASATLSAGCIGPVLPEEGVMLAWRPFRAFPEGCAVVRSHSDTGTDARLPDKGKVRLSWAPTRARQALTSGGKRFTPGTFRGASIVATIPTRTAAYLAAGGRFDQDVETAYQGSRFVGWRAVKDTSETPVKRAARVARDRTRRTITPQHAAMVTLIVDAAVLTMYDGRPRTAHRDQDGTGWVITRTAAGVLSLVTPHGITTPLPTDPRRMTAAVRAQVTA